MVFRTRPTSSLRLGKRILGFAVAAALYSTSAGATDVMPVDATPGPPAIAKEVGYSWKNVPTQTIEAGGVMSGNSPEAVSVPRPVHWE